MKFSDFISKYLFPPKCVFCRRVMEKDGVCKTCKSNLPYREPEEVRESIMFIDKAFSCFHYENDVRNAIIRFKFGGLEKYSIDFSKYLERCIKKNLDGEYDIISWVPLSKKRLRFRGYDQARVLADDTCARLGTKAVRTLVKCRNAAPQSRQADISKRKANILGAYEVFEGSDIVNKRIILIDDVLTTGSTTAECARVLKTAGADKVYIVTLAKARSKKIIEKSQK